MDVLVSARTTPAKKDAVQRKLESKGLSLSQLINSALDYFMEEGELPGAAAREHAERDAEGFASFVQASTLPVDWGAVGDNPADYKKLLQQGKQADYESLA
ncbi:MAG: hypothetical protein IJJ14_03425 [Coriobacteriales bacterium]|nr:hypothetical protein [Coriobacteriales bacterium]MBQ6586653.1 hypothetical protein [Coriobacteriales bacterium]